MPLTYSLVKVSVRSKIPSINNVPDDDDCNGREGEKIGEGKEVKIREEKMLQRRWSEGGVEGSGGEGGGGEGRRKRWGGEGGNEVG